MKKYEYKEIYHREGDMDDSLIVQINKLGKKGWRLISVQVGENWSSAFLEKETPIEVSRRVDFKLQDFNYKPKPYIPDTKWDR